MEHTYDNERVLFTVEGAAHHIDGWAAGDVARCDALGALRTYGEEHAGTVSFNEDRIVASHVAVASLRKAQAHALGLPGWPPFVLFTDTSGVIGSRQFKLITRWLNAAGMTVATNRRGAFLETARGRFLIPEPLFSAIELANGFEAGALDLPDHWTALARFRSLLDPDTVGDNRDLVEMGNFLRHLHIYTSAALSLTLSEDAGEVDFDPVLFDADAVQKAKDEGRPLSENEGMLPDDLLRAFQERERTGFRAFDSAKRSYLLSQNTYLIVDDDVETALQVVREKQRAGSAERRAFATNPRAAIAERLAEILRDPMAGRERWDENTREEEMEARAAALFFETPEYADRAIGIGIWEQPDLGFLPYAPNVWLPEIFALELGGVWVRIDRKTVAELRNKIDNAIEEGSPEIDYKGQRIPATEDVREKLARTVATETPERSSDDDTSKNDKDNRQASSNRTVVVVHENYVEENWSPSHEPREALIPMEAPRAIATELLGHQHEALEWQIKAWKAGHPGVLNADDQGLGKTLQTLAFIAWLQDNMAKGPMPRRQPVLIVSPTGLLRTWEAEEQTHTTGTGLGVRIDAYGSALQQLRIPGLSGRDTDDGEPRLSFQVLQSAIEHCNGHRCWVLTTYDTLANFQHSFRQFEFSVAVFDEIQKIKNVRTLIALAARAVKADFRVGLTGTPIENHVADLWAIMDTIAPGHDGTPGRLGTLSSYLDRYQIVTEGNMRELHGRLFKPVRGGGRSYPPIAQRRFKESEIVDLPRKDYRLYPATMPQNQAEAYELARGHLADGARGAALKVLHHIRGVSLHPEAPESMPNNTDIHTYFARSARFEAVRKILLLIHGRRERALIFTEDRRMQAFVAQWICSEFNLDRVRIINGATTIGRRKQYISEFQKHLENGCEFDVIILSPRAAGVGLTLTAATHVIHLSRWWNPAVEEQCNDRIYRIGQKRDVTVHLPLAIHPDYREGSFDCVLNDLMRRKTLLARAALWPATDNDFDNGMLVTGVRGADPFDPTPLDNLDWKGFEDWIICRACKSGDWEASETPWAGDAGVDAVLRHRHRCATTAIVQAKHTTDQNRLIDEGAVRDLLRANGCYELCNPQLVAITNARGFTENARRLALEHDVKLVDRDRLGLWPNHVLG